MDEYIRDELETVYGSILNWGNPINLDLLNEEMTISQVIKFFGRYDMYFTKTMIQNYIRIGLLPGPVEKRYYTSDHLILLFLIYQLKESFALEEIKKVFKPVINADDNLRQKISCMDLYVIYCKMHAESQKTFNDQNPVAKRQLIDQILADTMVAYLQDESLKIYMVSLYFMIETVTTKHLALSCIDTFFMRE
ncbi:MAG: DUF1836 domain-containing protein [Cellulosilyticaceae bacterium]